MGIARGAVGLLMHEAQRRPFSGTLATMGRQTIILNRSELVEQFRKFELQPKSPVAQGGKSIDDQELFSSMGFDVVHSLDFSDYEGATHLVDLNAPDLPAGMKEQYDVVLDSGTIEHVFHVPHAIRQITQLAKVGGRVIFLTPSSNHFEHSFYMFSPTFFFDWFMANKFRVETLYVVRYDPDPGQPWGVYGWQPNEWRDVQIGGLDDKPYAIWVVATKTAESTDDVIPQQGLYADDVERYAGSRLASDSSSSRQGAGKATLREEPLMSKPTTTRPGISSPKRWMLWLLRGALRRIERMIQRLSPPPQASATDPLPSRRLIGRF